MGKTIIPVALLLLAMTKCFSQSSRCNNNVNYSWLQANAPERYQRFMELDDFTTNFINNQGQSSNRLINGSGLIIIPVVVHVLHYGETVGAGYNISMAVIQSQIDVLNEDYRRLNADASNTPSVFQGVASDFNIEFRLACIDPNGNPSTGVVRKQTSISTFNGRLKRSDDTPDDVAIGIKTEPNGSVAWNTLQYLNIWVCNVDVDGYATYPSDNPLYQEFDGVVIDKQAFGRIGGTGIGRDKGRTATHEIGHWLNLNHIWDSNCSDDGVGDTPKQNFYHVTCPPFPELDYRCDLNDPSTMFMNYLDVTDDDCLNLFTTGQKNRSRALFASGGGILTRVSHLNNWFKVHQKVTPIRCTGKIFSSAACLPTTWTILSGPATIVTNQDNQATIQATGIGTVLVRAVSGNYISEENIEVSNVAPTVTGTYQVSSNYNNGSWSTLGPNNSFFLPANQFAQLSLMLNSNTEISSLSWTNSGSYQVQIYPANNGYFLSWSMQAVSPNGARTTTNNLTYQSSCGTSTSPFNFTVVTSSWYRIMATPNPSTENLVLTVKDLSNRFRGSVINQMMLVELVDINTGLLVKTWKMRNNQENYTLNLRGVRTGQYLLKVSIGKYKETIQVQVAH